MKNQVLKTIDEVNELMKDKRILDIFPKSNLEIIRSALIDAFMLGFSLDNFAKGDIYILDGTNGNKYNIVASIDYYRKMVLAWGLIEVGQPLYEYDKSGNPLSCSIKVIRNLNGRTITTNTRVFMIDYDKGSGLWLSKPFVMLAKVCEAAAYRKSFPEILSKIYIEEEFEKELGSVDEVNKHKEKLEKSGSISELKYLWSKLPSLLRKDEEFINLKDKLKEEL